MKVLQVCAYAAPYDGNFIKALKMLDGALAAEGHETLYAFPETAAKQAWCQALAATRKVYFLPLARARLRPAAYRAVRRVFRENPEIMIAHSHFELYDVPLVTTAPRKVRVFWHLHDAIELFDDFKNRVLYRLQYGVFHGRARLLAVSEWHQKYVQRLGFPAAQTAWLPNGIDTARISPVQTPVGERPFDFLMFGWLYRCKGVDLAVKALLRTENAGFRLGVVGSGETERMLTEEFGRVPENVTILEPVKDVNEVYAKAKCFLHISRAEGMSYALLEALAAGLPVICSDIPVNLFAETFPAVRLVKSEDPDAVAEAMKTVRTLCRPEDTETSRRMVMENYSLESWTGKVRKEYEL